MKRSKNWRENRKNVDRLSEYEPTEAITLLKEQAYVKFDEHKCNVFLI